jgi:DnaJ homolog subfamily C member 19
MIKLIIFGLIIAATVWMVRNYMMNKTGMTLSDAAKLLEVSTDADADAINAAHKRLIARVHPDAGGSAELASRVNQARDVMLKRLSR